jgi:hypothetical protein
MRKRIIINIRDDTAEQHALICVAKVIDMGRVSDDGKSYCYASQFDDNTMVTADRTSTSDIFNVWKGKVIK